MAETKKSSSKLEHTQGGVTTRDDALDAGVAMVAGRADEPVGPEDAFGPGPKRGDYSNRIDQGPHLVSEPVENPKEGEPVARLVDVSQRAGNVGDADGKGGVTTA